MRILTNLPNSVIVIMVGVYMIVLKINEAVLRIMSQRQAMKLYNNKFATKVEITEKGKHI